MVALHQTYRMTVSARVFRRTPLVVAYEARRPRIGQCDDEDEAESHAAYDATLVRLELRRMRAEVEPLGSVQSFHEVNSVLLPDLARLNISSIRNHLIPRLMRPEWWRERLRNGTRLR